MCVCVCDLILETTRFCYLDKLSIDRMRCERSELQGFCCKNVSLRRYGSFNGLVVLPYLELLKTTGELQKPAMLFHF